MLVLLEPQRLRAHRGTRRGDLGKHPVTIHLPSVPSAESSLLEGVSRRLLSADGTVLNLCKVWVDNTSAIAVAKADETRPKSRHYALRWFRVRDHARKVCFCPTGLMRADGLTRWRRHLVSVVCCFITTTRIGRLRGEMSKRRRSWESISSEFSGGTLLDFGFCRPGIRYSVVGHSFRRSSGS